MNDLTIDELQQIIVQLKADVDELKRYNHNAHARIAALEAWAREAVPLLRAMHSGSTWAIRNSGNAGELANRCPVQPADEDTDER